MKVLIVDDDRDFAESLAELMEDQGHQGELAFSGEEAIQKWSRDWFDLTLMDVKLPGLSGVESMVEIRKSSPDARVVMVTGYATSGLLLKARELGAAAVLIKPIDPDELLEIL